MLGDKVGSFSGRTAMKPLPAVQGLPVFETVDAGSVGTIYGVEATSFATFTSTMRADGSWLGELPNSGVMMAADGVATFRAHGVGTPTPDGGFSFRGSAFFEAAAPSLSRLNGKAMVWEYEVDAEGNSTWDIWEWV
ncbi:MAG: hypothetical protein ACPGN4_07180 [Miltoncostaeaceae bacterium]